MWWKSTTEYVSLETSNEDMKSDNEMHTRLPRSRQIFRIIAPWCIHAALLSISSTFYFQASSLNGLTKSLTGPPVAHEYGPAVDAVGARYPQTSSVGFLDRSVYRGSPSPELDAAWDHITQEGGLAVPRADMIRMEKLVPSSVFLTEEKEESYEGAVEVLHQLHCLNLVRQMTYFDYYMKKEPENFGRPDMRSHADHCIEMLRTVLMCNADLHLITMNWVDLSEHVWPDFGNTKMCRNFDNVLEWGVNHFTYTTEKGGIMKKPKNASVLHLVIPEEESYLLKFNATEWHHTHPNSHEQ